MTQSFSERIFWHYNQIAQRQLREKEVSLLNTVKSFYDFFCADNERTTAESDKPFLRFYLRTTTNLCIRFLSVNIVLLLGTVYVITQKEFGLLHIEIDPSFNHFYPAVVEIAIWILLSATCLAYFVALKYNPQLFQDFFAADPCEVWYEIGAAIMLSRLLILATHVYGIITADSRCAEALTISNAADTSFGYIFLKVATDAYQAYAFVIMPFPQPWAVFFTLIELTRQEIRLLDCAGRVTQGTTNDWIVGLAVFFVAVAYISLLLVPSLYLESSMRNRYLGDEQRRAADTTKHEMVGFLSTDVRVPLQYLLHSVQQIDLEETAGKSAEVIADIYHHSRVVNSIADDLLLLVRIKENRYTSKFTHVGDVRTLLNSMVQAVLQRRPADAAPQTGDCVIEATVPEMELHVDEKCLLTALRHLLIFLTSNHRDQQVLSTYPPADGASESISSRMRFEISARLESTAAESSRDRSAAPAHAEVLKVSVLGQALRKADWPEERHVHEATTAYVCNTIAAICGGTFVVEGTSYVLTLPCIATNAALPPIDVVSARTLPTQAQEVGQEHTRVFPFNKELCGHDSTTQDVMLDAPNTTRSKKSASDGTVQGEEQNDLTRKLENSTEMQARFKKNRVCVIVEDAVLVSVIVGVVRKLRLDEGLAVLQELQAGSVPIAKLTFVTSYQLCLDLRARKYQGLIVLFSGSSSYLDDAQMAKLDYCLPLPTGDLDLCMFLDWLIAFHNKSLRSPTNHALINIGAGARNKSANTRLRRIRSQQLPSSTSIAERLPLATAPVLQAGHVATVPTWWSKLSSWWVTLSASHVITPLPDHSRESICRWRFLNPSGSWRHRSREMWMAALPRMISGLVVDEMFFHLGFEAVFPPLVVMGMYLSMEPIYNYILKPCRIPLHMYLGAANLIIEVTFLFIVLQGPLHAPHPVYNLTLSEFLVHVFDSDGGDGRKYLYLEITTACYSRLFAIYQPYPLNMIALLLLLIRQSESIWLVFRSILSAQMCQFLQLLYIQMTILNVIYFMHLENTYRREFKTAHKHILDKAFLDQCLDICQHDIRKPLSYLLARQEDLMTVLVHAAYTRSIKVDRLLVSKLEPLQVSQAMLQELVQVLTCSRGQTAATQNGSSMQAYRSLQAVQLPRAVAGLISAFTSSAVDNHVRIYAEVDTRLAVVLVDWKSLSMVLTNLLTAALKNIQDYCIETPRNKDLTNSILLKFVALESTERQHFAQPRLMLINICDSSNAAAKAQSAARASQEDLASESAEVTGHAVSKYGRSVCEELVLNAHPEPLFETVAVQSSFQTAQRFTFTYHLTPQTRKSQEFLEAETDKDYVTMCVVQAAYFEAYQRIFLSKFQTVGPAGRPAPTKEVLYLSGGGAAARGDATRLRQLFENHGWRCNVKYLLNVPSMHTIASADCVLIDQQLEVLENVNICDTVLKLRVCGFNGLIAVVLQEGLRNTDLIKTELSRSAADIDLLILGAVQEHHVLSLSAALEKKCIRQLLYMNGN